MFFAKLALSALLAISASATPVARSVSKSFADLPKPITSPYYVYFGNSATKSLPDAFDQEGLTAATIGFGTAIPGQCKLTSDMDSLVGDAKTFIAKGGVVNLSFGGAIGVPKYNQHIQQACTDVNQLASLIKRTLLQFNTHNVEFDIEDDQLISDSAAAKRLAQAIVLVKQSIPDLHVTYTLAATPDGLPDGQLAQVTAARDAGLEIDVLSLMVMDMGVPNVLSSSRSAITAGAAQLEKVYGLKRGTGMAQMGVIPMIGEDDQGAMFNLASATSLANFAAKNGIAYYSFWSYNRDHPISSGSRGKGVDIDNTSGSSDQTTSSEFFSKISAAIRLVQSKN